MSNSFVGTLPPVNPTVNPWQHAQTTNQLVKVANRQDTFPSISCDDTGSATAYAIAPVPGIKFYRKYQVFTFKAANANSGTTPTLNVNGCGAGTITRIDGSALVAGDIPANGFVEVVCTSTTPTFALLTPPQLTIVNTGATTFLANDVALNNTANYFNGPNTGSIGASGQTWRISAIATMGSTSGAARMEAALHDGTNYIEAVSNTTAGANFQVSLPLEIIVTLSAATTFTLRGRDQSTTAGALQTTGGALAIANKATSITAARLA